MSHDDKESEAFSCWKVEQERRWHTGHFSEYEKLREAYAAGAASALSAITPLGEPKAYMVERDSCDPPRLYLTENLARANAAEGVADTHIVPLYSARQIEAASSHVAEQSTGGTIAAGKSASAEGECVDAGLPASAAPPSVTPQSETPRTDAHCREIGGDDGLCYADFARQLEHELAEAKQEAVEQRNLAGSLLHERDELAAARSSKGTPVAWRWRWRGYGMGWSYNESPMTDPAAECEPLFAASHVERKP